MKNLKNIFLLTLILLTSVLVGQTTQFPQFIGQSGCNPANGFTTSINIGGTTKNVLTTNFNVNLTYTVNINVSIATDPVVITNGTNTFTLSTSGTHTLVFNTTSTTKDSLSLTTKNAYLQTLSVVGNISATGINDINKSLPLTTYSNLNSIFVKNIQNIDDVKIEVFNLAGQLVFEDKVTKDKFELNVSTGIYIVRLSKDDNFVTKKVFLGE